MFVVKATHVIVQHNVLCLSIHSLLCCFFNIHFYAFLKSGFTLKSGKEKLQFECEEVKSEIYFTTFSSSSSSDDDHAIFSMSVPS